MQPTQNQKIIILIALGAALLFALVFLGILPGLKGEGEESKKIGGEISFWGLFDRQDAYGAALGAFKRKYPNIVIRYRQFNDAQDYKKTLLDALAAGAGPDVFMIHNNDLYQDSNKISPLPSDLYSLLQLKSDFPRVVEQDFAPQGVIYALPLSVDTMALIYNRDLLNAKAVVVPDTWGLFTEAAARLTKLSAAKTIEESGAAIGGAIKTIDTATDVLALLML
ncbi:MAG: extracellular solute-binding protein, partial [Patescibacteria group bacterium]